MPGRQFRLNVCESDTREILKQMKSILMFVLSLNRDLLHLHKNWQFVFALNRTVNLYSV